MGIAAHETKEPFPSTSTMSPAIRSLRLFAAVEDAVASVAELGRTIIERAERIRAIRDEDQPYRDIVPHEQRPLIVELLTESSNCCSAVGSRLRRVEASVLYEEGLTMDEIATLFGVTRQRVSVLLQSPEPT